MITADSMSSTKEILSTDNGKRRVVIIDISFVLKYNINIITKIDIILIICNCFENGLIPINKFDNNKTINQIIICIKTSYPN